MWTKPSVRGILFDVGGVLVETDFAGGFKAASLLFGCTEAVLKRESLPLIEHMERGEMDSYSMWEELGDRLEEKGLGVRQAPEKCETLWRDFFAQNLRVRADVVALARRLARTFPVGILSNTIEDHARHLRRQGIYSGFAPVLLSHELGCRKPDPTIYRQASLAMKLKPKEILLVDDLPSNIKVAERLKMRTHLFSGLSDLEVELSRWGFA